MEKDRLRWQCRRGMRELDVLLTRWLDHSYDRVVESDRSAFQRLLTLPDPELASYLIAGESPEDPEIAGIVQRIRGTDYA